MISQAALDELAGFAGRGQLGYGLELQCSDLHPEADSIVTLEWDFTATGCLHGVLEISEVKHQVQPVGQHRVNVGFESVRVCLMVDGESTDTIIRPRIVEPYAHLDTPAEITLGEPFELVWETNADSCFLRVVDGELVQELEVAASGGLEIKAQCLGDLHISIKAMGRHARLSPAGITRLERKARVLPPPLQLFLDATDKTALFGEEVTFEWLISGAKHVRIIAIDRGITYEVPMQGKLVVEAGLDSETFEILATGLGGEEIVRELRVNPRLLDLDDGLEELIQLINEPWEKP